MAGIVVAAESYGQGSSREHAALCPMYLGIRMVLAKSIERIHKANLINFCLVPVTFSDPADYDKINADDELVVENITEAIKDSESVMIKNVTCGTEFKGCLELSARDREILLAGGLLSYTKKQ